MARLRRRCSAAATRMRGGVTSYRRLYAAAPRGARPLRIRYLFAVSRHARPLNQTSPTTGGEACVRLAAVRRRVCAPRQPRGGGETQQPQRLRHALILRGADLWDAKMQLQRVLRAVLLLVALLVAQVRGRADAPLRGRRRPRRRVVRGTDASARARGAAGDGAEPERARVRPNRGPDHRGACPPPAAAPLAAPTTRPPVRVCVAGRSGTPPCGERCARAGRSATRARGAVGCRGAGRAGRR